MNDLEPGDAIRLNDQPAEVIAEYERKAEAGTDMDIAIRGQRNRLSKLEDRIEQRRQELRRKAQVISLAPEIENLCLSLSI